VKTILGVSTDSEDCEASQTAWEQHGYNVSWAHSISEVIARLSYGEQYLFIGINEDTIDFWNQLPTLRTMTETPIFVITSTYTTLKKSKALDLGADAYDSFADSITENICGALSLLNARTRAAEQAKNDERITIGDITLFPIQREVLVSDKEIKLTKTEFDVLYFLMINHRYVMTYEQIYCNVWKNEYDESANNVIKTIIQKTRSKVGRYIVSVRGVGYRFTTNSR
jgi:DNA-binding response OmpR family regulator